MCCLKLLVCFFSNRSLLYKRWYAKQFSSTHHSAWPPCLLSSKIQGCGMVNFKRILVLLSGRNCQLKNKNQKLHICLTLKCFIMMQKVQARYSLCLNCLKNPHVLTLPYKDSKELNPYKKTPMKRCVFMYTLQDVDRLIILLFLQTFVVCVKNLSACYLQYEQFL